MNVKIKERNWENHLHPQHDAMRNLPNGGGSGPGQDPWVAKGDNDGNSLHITPQRITDVNNNLSQHSTPLNASRKMTNLNDTLNESKNKDVKDMTHVLSSFVESKGIDVYDPYDVDNLLSQQMKNSFYCSNRDSRQITNDNLHGSWNFGGGKRGTMNETSNALNEMQDWLPFKIKNSDNIDKDIDAVGNAIDIAKRKPRARRRWEGVLSQEKDAHLDRLTRHCDTSGDDNIDIHH